MLHPWKSFLQSLHLPLAFYYRKEFVNCYGRADLMLPVVLLECDGGGLETLVSANEINACADLQALIEKVRHSVAMRTGG